MSTTFPTPAAPRRRRVRVALGPLCLAILLAASPIVGQVGPSRTVRAAVFDDWLPYYEWSVDGQPVGFAVDVMDAVAARADIGVDYVRFTNSRDAFEALIAGTIDVVPNFGISDTRAGAVAFTRPFVAARLVLFARDSESATEDLRDVDGRRVGVVVDNTAMELVPQRLPDAEMVVFDDPRELLVELLTVGVDAAAYQEEVFRLLARSAGVTDRIRVIEPPLAEVTRGMAVRSGDAELLAQLDGALDDLIGTPEYDAIYSSWFIPPPPFWTVQRVASVAAGLLLVALVGMAGWRYRSVSRLAARLRTSLADRDRAEEGRRREQERFATLVSAAYEGIVASDAEGRIEFVNRRIAELLAVDDERELAGTRILDWVTPEHHDRIMRGMARRREGKSDSYEVRLSSRDGRNPWVLLSAAPVRDASGTVVGSMATLADITSRVEAEEKLEETSRFLRQTLTSLDQAVFVVDTRERKIVECNRAAEILFGHDRATLIGNDTRIIHVSAEHHRQFGEESRIALERGESYEGEFVMRRSDGSTFPTWHVVTLLHPDQGPAGGVVSTVRDISRQRDAERRLRLFYTHLQEAREDERAAVAREIHDELGQTLTALKLDLSGIQRAAPELPGHIMARVDRMDRSLDAAIDDVRQIAAELRPGLLDDLGLISALEQLCDEFRSHSQVRCSLSSAVQSVPIAPAVGIHVYRVAQEALTNVARHSRASEVSVLVSTNGSSGKLVVRDDGKGMPPVQPARSRNRSLGIIGMQERARIIGGRLEIRSVEGHGTEVELVFPIDAGL